MDIFDHLPVEKGWRVLLWPRPGRCLNGDLHRTVLRVTRRTVTVRTDAGEVIRVAKLWDLASRERDRQAREGGQASGGSAA